MQLASQKVKLERERERERENAAFDNLVVIRVCAKQEFKQDVVQHPILKQVESTLPVTSYAVLGSSKGLKCTVHFISSQSSGTV